MAKRPAGAGARRPAAVDAGDLRFKIESFGPKPDELRAIGEAVLKSGSLRVSTCRPCGIRLRALWRTRLACPCS